MNVAHLLDWSARRHGDRTAFVAGDREFTFHEVDDRSNRLAAALIELGVAKRDRVGVLVSNRPEYLEAEFAIAKAGAVRVPMLISLTPAEVRGAIEHTGISAVVASDDSVDTLRQALEGLDRTVEVIVIGAEAPNAHAYEDLIAGSAPVGLPDLVEDDLYAIRVTGGTTGAPKAVAMSHRCMVSVINNMLLNWPVAADDVVLSVHPLSHASGMISYPFWARGAKNVIRPAFGFDAEAFLEDVERHRVTAVFLIPTVLNYLLDSPALETTDHSSLRSVIYGGAPIPLARLRQALDLFGPVFIQIYGTTEAPNALTTLLPHEHLIAEDEEVADDDVPARLSSAGREVLNVEVRVVLPDGRRAAAGEVGEVISRGPHTMDGYWGNDELTAQRLRDGWVHTGDMGKFDEDGYLYIVDRKDDMVITGGFNVWPAEVEGAICEHPAVRETAVFGVEHDRWGEAVAAAVVLRPGEALDQEELTAFLGERLARYKVPKCVVFRSEPIPKSAVGKNLRRKAREAHIDELQELLA